VSTATCLYETPSVDLHTVKPVAFGSDTSQLTLTLPFAIVETTFAGLAGAVISEHGALRVERPSVATACTAYRYDVSGSAVMSEYEEEFVSAIWTNEPPSAARSTLYDEMFGSRSIQNITT
jgi:hypothetical protein